MDSEKTPLSATAALPVAAQWGRVCPLLPLNAPPEPPSVGLPVETPTLSQSALPVVDPNPWHVKAAARADGETVTLEMVVMPGPLPPPTETQHQPSQGTAAPIAPPPPVSPDMEALWEKNPEQAAEQMPPPLPPPETVQTLRVTPLRRFFGDVPVWQPVLWLGLMAMAVAGGLMFGHWLVRRFPEFEAEPALTEALPAPTPTEPRPGSPLALLALTNARPTTTWQMGQGRLERYEFTVPYATAYLAIVTGRTNVGATAQQLLAKRWFGSGRFEPEPNRIQRLPVTLCGQALDLTREEGLYRFDSRAMPAIRDRLTLPRGDRQQAMLLVAYGRNPPRLAEELRQALACR